MKSVLRYASVSALAAARKTQAHTHVAEVMRQLERRSCMYCCLGLVLTVGLCRDHISTAPLRLDPFHFKTGSNTPKFRQAYSLLLWRMEGGRIITVFEPINGEENTSAYDSSVHDCCPKMSRRWLSFRFGAHTWCRSTSYITIILYVRSRGRLIHNPVRVTPQTSSFVSLAANAILLKNRQLDQIDSAELCK